MKKVLISFFLGQIFSCPATLDVLGGEVLLAPKATLAVVALWNKQESQIEDCGDCLEETAKFATKGTWCGLRCLPVCVLAAVEIPVTLTNLALLPVKELLKSIRLFEVNNNKAKEDQA